MKKLKLNISNLQSAEILTREQLKKVMGGLASGSGAACPSDCSGSCTAGGANGKCRWTSDKKTCYCATAG